MQYLLTIYVDESASRRRDDLEARASARMQAGVRGARRRGLQPTHATTVRVRDGERMLTDGPIADDRARARRRAAAHRRPVRETREQLGGYYLVECADLDEAMRWAAQDPRRRAPAASRCAR